GGPAEAGRQPGSFRNAQQAWQVMKRETRKPALSFKVVMARSGLANGKGKRSCPSFVYRMDVPYWRPCHRLRMAFRQKCGVAPKNPVKCRPEVEELSTIAK